MVNSRDEEAFDAMAVSGHADEMLESSGRSSKADRKLAREIAKLSDHLRTELSGLGTRLSYIDSKVDKLTPKLISLESEAALIRRSIKSLEREIDRMQDDSVTIANIASSVAATTAANTTRASMSSNRRISERMGGMVGRALVSTLTAFTR